MNIPIKSYFQISSLALLITTKVAAADPLSSNKEPSIPPQAISLVSGTEQVLNVDLNINIPAWDPTRKAMVPTPAWQVFKMDSPPFNELGGLNELIFANYRCAGSDLGFHAPASAIQGNFQNAWCSRQFFDPWQSPASWFGFWAQATLATWSTHHLMLDDGLNLVSINFTENKSMKGQSGSLRRGPAPWNFWGYTNFKMDGTPTDPSESLQNLDDTMDGFYMGFITIAIAQDNLANGWGSKILPWDYGPIIWPRHGYRRWNPALGDGKPTKVGLWQQTSLGVRHPRAFSHGGYLYVFYLSQNGLSKDGKTVDTDYSGIYVARAEISSRLRPGSFKCGTQFNTPCLPTDFSVATQEAFEKSLGMEGPDVKPMIADSQASGFGVAYVEDKNYFIGALETYDGNTGRVKLFVSNDLVRWTYIADAPKTNYTGSYYGQGKFHYPTFVNSNTGVTNRINSSSFYLVGSDGIGCSGWPCHVNRLKLRIN